MTGTFGFCSKAFSRFLAGEVLRDGSQTCQQLADAFDLVSVHRVAHARIDALGDFAAEPAENIARLIYPREWDVRVDVGTAEEHRRAGERTRIVARCAGRADQPGGKARHRAVALGI